MPLTAPATVGRERELRTLSVAMERARRGQGGAIFLVGEAGIGKSRIAGEVTGRAFGAGMRVLRGRGSLLGATVPFRPIAEALLGMLRAEGAPHHADLVSYQPALGRLVPEWRQPDRSAEPESIVVLAEAVLRVVSLAGAGSGCLLVLEDLHDADAETLTVVEYLVDNLDRQPVLLLGTVRAEAGVALELAANAQRRRAATMLEVPPLTGDAVARLAAGCLDVAVGGVPAGVVDRLRTDCGGNPFVVEELLDDLVDGGLLTRVGQRWRVSAEMNGRVPVNVVRSILDRADRLGPQGHEVLATAAVLGHRFPLAIVQETTGLDDRTLLSHLHAGHAARLVVADDQSSDWYAFRHALTAEALLAGLGPVRRAAIARRAADVVEARYPDLPNDWCQLAAHLRLVGGDPVAASRCLAEAGRRALAGGAAESAVMLLERARDLLAGEARSDGEGADLLELLLLALIDAGQFDRALAYTDQLDTSGGALSPLRRAKLRGQLAWAAAEAGRRADGLAQVAVARAQLATVDDDACAALLDVVDAHLLMHRPGTDLADVERLANRAVEAAERVAVPIVACRALHLMGLLARKRGIDGSARYFERLGAVADAHGLSVWRIRASALLAANDVLREGTTGRLRRVCDEAMRVGAVVVGYELEAALAFQYVLCGDYPAAQDSIDRCWPSVVRLGQANVVQYLAAARAALAAHRGRRREMELALDEFRRRDGEQSPNQSLALGLCRAVCALLEEDGDEAYAELAREAEYEARNPTVYHLAGRYGLHLLLRVLRGEAGAAECRAVVESPAGQLRWNRQFALLALAVAHGRAGDAGAADKMAAQARDAAEPFAMARHLAMRLAGEAAATDGWGEPVTWLREAEAYFHRAGVAPVALACRTLLRCAGATVGQRRDGYEQVPDELRRLRVTTREYDTLELLADRLGNKEIAERLFISPRTVEKHVASLLAKTGQSDRAALSSYAATVVNPLRPTA